MPVVHVEGERLADDVRHEQIFGPVAVEVSGGDAHAAFGVAGGVDRGARQQPFVDERAVVMVDPELVRRGVVRDVDVGPAVPVVIAGRDAEPGAERPGDSRWFGDVGEAPVAVVVEQPGGDRTVRARAAVVARADGVVADLVRRRREVQIVRDEQVEVAVAIVVHERGARAPERIAQARG